MKRTIIILALCMMGAFGAEAQIIGANTGDQPTPTKPRKEINFRKAKGPQIRIEAGYPTLASVAFNYQLSQYFMIGAGAGYGFKNWEHIERCRSYRYSSSGTTSSWYYKSDGTELSAIPVFVHTEFRTMAWSGWSLFANVRLGVNLGLGNNSDEVSFVQNDYYGDPVYYYDDWTYGFFLWQATVGWSFKNFNYSIGYGHLGFQTSVSFDIPLKK